MLSDTIAQVDEKHRLDASWLSEAPILIRKPISVSRAALSNPTDQRMRQNVRHSGSKFYPTEFYHAQEPDSRRSAEVIVPILLELFGLKSVVDVGCGTGAWLSVFQELGIEDILGIDGEWIDRRALRIPPEKFRAIDLSRSFKLSRKFDLAMSLEVAEHLPASSAETFVDTLVSLSPVVLFSAAIPGQGGTHHVNEQWPGYWARLFESRGYLAIDCIRRRVWDNAHVQWYYAQNALVFVAEPHLKRSALLMGERERTHLSQLALVHPARFLAMADSTNRSVRRLVRLAIATCRNWFRRPPRMGSVTEWR